MASLAPLELLPPWRASEAIPCSLQAAVIERDWRAFDTSAEIGRWDALARWAAEPNPFLESWALLPALRAFDPAGKVTLLCLEANGQLAGLLPVSSQASYYGRPLPHWRGWLHANAFVGAPLIAQGFETVFWRAALEWLDRHAGRHAFAHFAQMPLDGSLYAALREVLAEQGRPAALVHRYERAMLQSRLSPEAYFEQSLNPKRRKELRRREKRLAEQGEIVIERRIDATGLDEWIEEFLGLERSGWKGEAGSALASRAETEAMFREMVRGAAQRGRLERLTLRLDGRAIAILTTFLAPPAAFGFKTAYDEAFARSSPGVYLQREFLAILDRSDIAWCDSCAAPDHAMIDHFWRERRPIGTINTAIGGPLRRALFRGIARLETGRFPGELP